VIKDQPAKRDEQREAQISRTADGPVGAVLFVTPEELEQMNVDPEADDTVVIRVEDGFLILES
jgi:hypothetical protein